MAKRRRKPRRTGKTPPAGRPTTSDPGSIPTGTPHHEQPPKPSGGAPTGPSPDAILAGNTPSHAQQAAAPPSAAQPAGPSVTESSTYRQAARQQAALIQKYAIGKERDRLADKHYAYDAAGKITKRNATTAEIHADLKKARENVRKTTELLFSSPRVHQANVVGRVVTRKKLERIEATRTEKVHEYNQAVHAPARHARQRSELQELTNVTIPKLQKRSQRLSAPQSPLDLSLLGPTEADRQKRLDEVTGHLQEAQTEAQRLSGLVRTRRGRRAPPVTPTEVALALASAIPVGRLGSAAWKAAVAARATEGAVTSQAVRAAAERLLPQGIREGAATGLQAVSKVPGLGNVAEGLRFSPFKTAAGTSLKGGLAFGAVTGYKEIPKDLADLGQWAADLPAYADRAGDVGDFLWTTPKAILKTGEELLTSGEARRQTLFGARDLAIGATAFPFLAGYEAATEGPAAAFETFSGDVKHSFKSAIGPALRGDWDTFQARMERPGMGGAAIPLSFLVPAAAITSRGLLKAGQASAYTAARASGLTHPEAVGVAEALAIRKDLKYGPATKQVHEYDPNRGIVGAIVHGAVDLARQAVHSRRDPRKAEGKIGTVPEGAVAPLVPGRGINKYRRGRSANKIVSQESMAGAYRGRQLLRGSESLRALIKRHGKHGGLLSYAIELGVPKDAASMIATLRAKLADIKRNPSDHPSAGVEVPQIEKLIAELEKNPKIISKRFRADTVRAHKIIEYFEQQAPFFESEGAPGKMAQTEVRHYAEQAEQLAKREGSQLPSLVQAIGRPQSVEAAKARLGQAKRAYETAKRRVAIIRGESTAAVDMSRRTRKAYGSRTAAKTEYEAAKAELKAAKAGLTWESHARAYVRAVGKEAIDAEAQRRGLGEPGYMAAYEGKPRPTSITKSQTSSTMTPQRSKGSLAREGARDISTFRLLETAEKLNRAITDVLVGQRTADELTRDPAEALSALEGKKVSSAEVDALTAEELTHRLADAGMDLTHVQLFNAEALYKKYKMRSKEDLKGQRRGADGKIVRFDEEEFDARMFDDITSVTVSAEKLRKGKVALPSDVKDKGWQLIGDVELKQLRGRFRPYGHLGEHRIWGTKELARVKTLASKYLLAHPSWFAFQVYANAYLAGIAEPGSYIVPGYRRWQKQAPEAAMQNFERGVGIPFHHPDLGTEGASVVAGYFAFTKGMKQSDFYQLHLAGRNPLDALFFRPEVQMEHYFKSKVFYTKARREAYKRMGVSMNTILTVMDEYFGRHNTQRIADFDKVLNDLMSNPKDINKIADATSSFMGDYATFNHHERTVLANNVLFYGFIRHSLMLSLYTLPVKHPLRTGLIAQMGQVVNTEQKKTITAATRDWLREMMLNMGYSPTQASYFSQKFDLPDNEIPVSLLGSFVLPDGTVIDLKRSSFAGSLPVEAHSPFQLVSSLNPVSQFVFESVTGIDTFTGQPIQINPDAYRFKPGVWTEDPKTPGPDTFYGAPNEWAKYAATSALSYISPLRTLSSAVSALPFKERTATSFPLPGPFNLFPEVPLKHSTNLTKGRAAVERQIQYEAAHGWRSVSPELFPFFPHESAAIPALAMAWLYRVSQRSEDINRREAAAEKKKPDRPETGYGSIDLKGSSSDGGYGAITLPGQSSSDKKDETTYAESIYKVLRNVFDVTDVQHKTDKPPAARSGTTASVPTTVPRRNNTQRPEDQGEPGKVRDDTITRNRDPQLAKNPPPVRAKIHEAINLAIATAERIGQAGPDSRVLAKAAVKYGKQEGVPPSILYYQLGVESTHGTDRTGPPTPYGPAQGDAQFIKGTRDQILADYGVDAWGSPAEAVHAQALLLEQEGYADNPQAALFAYNHSQAYVDQIVTGAKNYPMLDKASGKHIGDVEPHPFLTVNRPAKVEVADGANRDGVPLTSDALDFAASASRKLTGRSKPVITTGSNHSQMTASGNVSDHWSGNGMDFGLAVNSGGDMAWGDDFATAAIEAAGVPHDEARAMAEGGGIHNLPVAGGTVQIIWRAADHYDHVHIGVEPSTPSAAPTTTDSGTTLTSYAPSGSPSGTYEPALPSPKKRKEPKPRFSKLDLLKATQEPGGIQNLLGLAPTEAAPEGDATMAALAEIASTRKRLLKR